MHYVYVLKSKSNGGHYYVGETDDLRRRFKQHNAGASTHTAKFRPWALHWYAGFASEAAALRFEAFLKTGAGREFQKKRLE